MMNRNDQAVFHLQTYLRLVAHHEDGISKPPVDGIFDSATERSVREYQSARGLPADGKVNEETWNRIYADYCALLDSLAPPLPVPIFPETENALLSLGCRDFSVATLRFLLSELHNSHASIPVLPLSDLFDTDTQTAVLAFQSLFSLPQTGSVDKLCWDTLVREGKD